MLSITLFVDDDAASGGDGLAWATAYDDLQSALTQAATLNADTDTTNDVDQIWIAEGTYTPSVELESGDARSASFSLLNDVTLYGGFTGTETTLTERDLSASHTTTLSGDLGVADDTSDNAYTVVYCGEIIEAVVDGLLIVDGYADGDFDNNFIHTERRLGGGVFNTGTLTIANSVLSDNWAELNGGGIYSGGTLAISNSVIENNSAMNGGGIAINSTLSSSDSFSITNSTIQNNIARGNSSGGGGIYCSTSTGVIQNSSISHNSATDGSNGGGIYSRYSTLTIENSVLTDNSASSSGCGGGIYCYNSNTLSIESSTISNNSTGGNFGNYNGGGIYCNESNTLTIISSSILGNSTTGSGNDGGAIYCDSENELALINSVIAENTAEGACGGISTRTSNTLSIVNSTITDNTGNSTGGINSPNDGLSIVNTIVAENHGTFYPDFFFLGGTISGSYNLIGDGTGLYGLANGINNNQVGTSSSPINPKLSNLTYLGNDMWGYRLRHDSPAIEAGESSLALDADGQPLSLDLYGKPRILHEQVDIGAYEYDSFIIDSGGPYTGDEGTPIVLDASGTIDTYGKVVSYEWDLDGDGLYDDAAGSTATYLNTNDGNHVVSLKVTDSDGIYGIVSVEITINNVAPTAQITGNTVINEGATTLLHASESSDPGNDIVSYAWDLNGDGLYDDAIGEEVDFSQLEDGSHIVSLKVTDDDGDYDTTDTTITVNNVAPTANGGGPYTINRGKTITLDASNSTDPGNDIAGYEWDLDNDGVYDDAFTATTDFNRTTSGTYTVNVRVTDDDGAYDTDSVIVQVINIAQPGGPYSANEGDTITLDASASFSTNGSITSYEWNLDDDIFYDDAIGDTVELSYTEDGIYSISLRVTDETGYSGINSTTITVHNVAPTADAGGPYVVDQGDTITLNASNSSDPGNDIVLYEWDLDNDGLYDDATGVTAEFSRIVNDTYTISVKVTDDDGSYQTDSTTVTVENVAPTASLASDLIVGENIAEFSVIYQDIVAISAATIDGNDILVTGPNGYSQNATLVNIDATTDGTPRTATYRVMSPGDRWLQSDKGTYQIAMVANQVSDTSGLFILPETLGTFDIITAVDDTVSITENATSLTIEGSKLTANDGGECSIIAITATADTHGQVELVDQTITYTPDATFSGEASFEYTILSDWGVESTATVTIVYPRTYVVDSLLDVVAVDGVTTLREAIQAANTNQPAGDAIAGRVGLDRIVFDPALYANGPATIVFSGTISDDIDIQGPGANLLTIDGAEQGSVFINESTATSTIAGLTITGGLNLYGGGVHNRGSLTLSDCMISNNAAGYVGCGVYNYQGELNVLNSTISDNYKADISFYPSCNGGGIYNNAGSVNVVNSTIAKNHINSSRSAGGGIYNYGILTVTNSTITRNSIDNTYSYYGGGGIFCGPNSTTTLNNTIVAQNSDTTGPDVFAHSAATLITGSNNLIGDGTQSSYTDGTDGNQVGTADSPIDPRLSTFTQFDNGLGGYYLLPDSPAVDAGSNNLAVDQDGQPLTEDITGNARIVDETVDLGAVEGAISGAPGQTYLVASLENTIANDGVLTFLEAFTAANTNHATGDAPAGSFSEADTIQFAAGLTGTVSLGNGELTIQDHLNLEGPGAELLTFDAAGQSRVFFVSEFVSASLSGIAITGGLEEDGGALYNKGVLTLTDVTLTNNTAESYGGAIYNKGELTLTDATLTDNTAERFGGAIFNEGTMSIANATIANNSIGNNTNTSGRGGGIYNAGEMTIAKSTISENLCKNIYAAHGGGIYNSGTLTVEDSTVSGNALYNIYSNESLGGGIFNDDTLTVINSIIVGNRARSGGGIADPYSNTLTIINSTITGNTATYRGGGVYNPYGTTTVCNSILALNNAGNYDPDYQISFDSNCSNNLLGDDPLFVRSPSDGGDGWADDPYTTDVDESANNDYGDLQLRLGSPAINLGSNALANDSNGAPLLWDIRGQGYHRVIGGTVDIGAVEYAAVEEDIFVSVVDQPLAGDVSNNDSVPTEGIFVVEYDAAHGNLLLNQDGTFSYVPEAGYQGVDSFTYRHTGLTEDIESATVTILVTAADGFFTVTTSVDEGELTYGSEALSLREALELAQLCEGDNTITFDPSMASQVITLDPALGELIIDSNVTIVCKGQVTIDANSQSRVFNVLEDATASIIGLRVTGGLAENGGGIYNDGTLTITNSIIFGNTALSEEDHDGGGIFNSGTLTLTNSTIINNSAIGGEYGFGGGCSTDFDSVTILNNTIIAKNIASYSNRIDFYTREIVSGSNNLIGNASECPLTNGENGNLVGSRSEPIDPMLDAEGFSLLGSPAIDTGSNALAINAEALPLVGDIRGESYPRIMNGTVDIGAFEYFGIGDDFFDSTVDQTIVGDVTTNDIPPLDESLLLVDDVAHGDLTLHSDGTFSYIPEAGYLGFDSFTYQYTGTPEDSNIATVSFFITQVENTFVVTTADDENDPVYDPASLSLREAIWTSERCEGECTILFAPALSRQTIMLDPSYGELLINSDVSISCADAITIDADGQSRVFNIPQGITVSIEGLVITGGQAETGAGILNNGTLILSKSSVLNNIADLRGGGILNEDGTLTLTNVTVANNSAGILKEISHGAGISNSGTLTITNSTIAGNLGNGIASGGTDSQITLNNTIVAGNSAISQRADLYVSDDNSVSGSGNLICVTPLTNGIVDGVNGNQVGMSIDPLLSEIALLPNGQWGYYLLPGSPAIDAGINILAVDPSGEALTEDLAGNSRILGDTVNLGAVESSAPTSTAQTYLVTSLEDTIANDGILTFVEAFQAANENRQVGDAAAGSFLKKDTIRFAPGLTGTVLLDPNELVIRGDLSIEGPAAELLTFDAQEQESVITVLPNTTVHLSGMTITGGTARRGGGIYCDSGTLTINDSVINGNTASYTGGGIFNYYGTVSVVNSIISQNTATSDIVSTDGGGVYNYCGTFSIANSIVFLNSAQSHCFNGTPRGGGINTAHGTLSIENSTIYRNSTYSWTFDPNGIPGNGVYCAGDASLTLNNSIVAGYDGVGTDLYYASTVSASIANNLIAKGANDSLVNGVDGNIVGTANGPIDPYFVREPSHGGDGWGDNSNTTDVDESLNDDYGDLRLQTGSQAINAGNNALVPYEMITDLDGNYRIADGTVDMGAYESGSTPLITGDANCDGRVDGSDVTILANNWQAGVTGDSKANWKMGDFNGDGKVDGSDVTILANNWQSGVNSTVVAVSGPEEEEESEETTTQFTPPANTSLGVATVPRRESLPPRRLITPTSQAADVALTESTLSESTWNESDYTAVAKDLVVASSKESTTARDKLFASEVDPYADFE